MKQCCLYCCLSFVMIGLALPHLSNMTPWVDEVMFMDTPMHYVNGKGWTTFAWYSVAWKEPFSLYPPLYAMMMVVWMNIFGTTMVACRSLNLFFTMLIGLGILRICRQVGQKLSSLQVVLLVMLLWCTDDMIYMYCNGRPDLLGAAILIFTISEMIWRIKTDKKGWFIVLLSALLLLSGIQAVVCLYILLLMSYLILKNYRHGIRKIAVLSGFGSFLGFLFLCAFMAYHGHLTAFIFNTLSYSSTLMNMAMIVLPVWSDYTGIDASFYMEKLANNTTGAPFYIRVLTIYTHPAYLSLLAVASFVYFSEHKRLVGSSLIVLIKLLFVYVLSIPMLMSMAGRFPDYYYWMVYLPIFLLVVVLAGFTKSICNHIIIALVSLLLCIKGTADSIREKNNSTMEAFVNNCTMLRNKSVAAPFSVFYAMEEMRGHTCHQTRNAQHPSPDTYYLGVYPSRYLPHVIDYVILPPKDSEYGASRLYEYYESINQSDSLSTVLVAESKAVGLKVYKVVRKSEFGTRASHPHYINTVTIKR